MSVVSCRFACVCIGTALMCWLRYSGAKNCMGYMFNAYSGN